MKIPITAFACAAMLCNPCIAESLQIPAFTAYTLPEPDALRISENSGITRWSDPATTVNWYGDFKSAGELNAKVVLQLPKDSQSKLKLSLGSESREVLVTGADSPVTADFGKFTISSKSYHRFTLTSLNAKGTSAGNIQTLLLTGPATEGAHFNLKERRNAASIHLGYKVPKDVKIAGIYKEITGITDPSATFYMACGFHRGYFGMQVNSPTERRIIFSVWDSGGEAIDRKKVAADDRVTLIAKGENVFSGDFGNEGTGGHSHLKYLWKTGDAQRFYLTAKPVDETHTIFAGYYFHPENKKWMLIAAWKAPKEGGWLRGLHGFSENFGGSSGHLVRKSLHTNEWALTDDGKWIELTQASFTHDATGKQDRLDRFMGVENGSFFLNHGGFVEGFTEYGTTFDRPAKGKAPNDLDLPALPK